MNANSLRFTRLWRAMMREIHREELLKRPDLRAMLDEEDRKMEREQADGKLPPAETT